MRFRPANIRLINRRKSWLDRYPLHLAKGKKLCVKINKYNS